MSASEPRLDLAFAAELRALAGKTALPAVREFLEKEASRVEQELAKATDERMVKPAAEGGQAAFRTPSGPALLTASPDVIGVLANVVGDELTKLTEDLKKDEFRHTRPPVKRSKAEKAAAAAASPPAAAATPVPAAAKPTAAPGIPTLKISNYGWDESDKVVKLYIPLAGVDEAPKEDVGYEFTTNSFSLWAHVDGVRHELTMRDLTRDVNVGASEVKFKHGMLVVVCRKAEDGKEWEFLTKTHKASKQENAPKLDTGAAADQGQQEDLKGLMKQMSDNDDEGMEGPGMDM